MAAIISHEEFGRLVQQVECDVVQDNVFYRGRIYAKVRYYQPLSNCRDMATVIIGMLSTLLTCGMINCCRKSFTKEKCIDPLVKGVSKEVLLKDRFAEATLLKRDLQRLDLQRNSARSVGLFLQRKERDIKEKGEYCYLVLPSEAPQRQYLLLFPQGNMRSFYRLFIGEAFETEQQICQAIAAFEEEEQALAGYGSIN